MAYVMNEFKSMEDVIEYLYVNKQPKLAQAVLDRERLLNEAWGKINILEKVKSLTKESGE